MSFPNHFLAQYPNPHCNMVVSKSLIYQLLSMLHDPDTRERALLELTMFRDKVPDLAHMIWTTEQTMSIFVTEIKSIYEYLEPPTLTAWQSKRVINVLKLLETVAACERTRYGFLQTKITELLIPYLAAKANTKPFEYLKLATLDIIATAMKDRHKHITKLMLPWGIFGHCFGVMENYRSSNRCTFLSLHIMQEIISSNRALKYYCKLPNRFSILARPLAGLVLRLERTLNIDLIRKVLGCYLRISEVENGLHALRLQIPSQITFPESLLCRHLNMDPISNGMHRLLMERIHAERPLFEQEPPDIYNSRVNSHIFPSTSSPNFGNAPEIPTSSSFSSPTFPFVHTSSSGTNTPTTPTHLEINEISESVNVHEAYSEMPSTSGNSFQYIYSFQYTYSSHRYAN